MASSSQPVSKFRPDIQGLRAIAVGLVVLYHAGVPFLPGGYVGVDVFFVISGYLITSHLLEGMAETGKVQFAKFYARRARRILPAAFVVLLASLLLGLIFLPLLRAGDLLKSAAYTAMYVPNIQLARDGADYLADPTPSLFQHYWSLGVEEQFYLVWPLLLVATFWLSRGSRRGMFLCVALVVVISFAACVYLSVRSQPLAFFSLPTRAWELGIGGLVAFGMTSALFRNKVFAAVAGWAGLLLIVAAGVRLHDGTLFPGYAAAIPVLGTALVIAAGNPAGGPGALLGLRPMQFIGAISYSLYLVHWPLLVIPEQAGGRGEPLGLGTSLALVFAGVPLAYLLYRFVERPAQRARLLTAARPRRTLIGAIAVPVAVAAACVLLLPVLSNAPLSTARKADPVSVATADATTPFVPANLTPSLRDHESDTPATYELDCQADFDEVEPIGCTFGDVTRSDVPVVALFGDSHAAQWFPALQELVDDGRIALRVDTKQSCPAIDAVKNRKGSRYVSCEQWRDNVLQELNALKPDVVVMSSHGIRDVGPIGYEEWGAGTARLIEQLHGAGRVVVLADTPRMGFVPAMCLSAHLSNTAACSQERSEALNPRLTEIERSAAEAAGASYVDLSDQFCGPTACGPIIGNTLVYRDEQHMTATFAKLLQEPLTEAVLRK
jgi:peptidoglycan/LPS O-acetylase OafA/YrhL